MNINILLRYSAIAFVEDYGDLAFAFALPLRIVIDGVVHEFLLFRVQIVRTGQQHAVSNQEARANGVGTLIILFEYMQQSNAAQREQMTVGNRFSNVLVQPIHTPLLWSEMLLRALWEAVTSDVLYETKLSFLIEGGVFEIQRCSRAHPGFPYYNSIINQRDSIANCWEWMER